MAGGAVSDSEREIDLGGARAVPLNLLPDFDYCALGHLHKRQRIGANAYYSGAPMQFSFDEAGAEKSVNFFDLTVDGVQNLINIPITSARRLIRLQANGAEDGIALLQANAQYFVELTLNLTEPLTANQSAQLHQQENLVALKAEVQSLQSGEERVSYKDKTASQLFSEYYKSRYGAKASAELLALFLSLTEEE